MSFFVSDPINYEKPNKSLTQLPIQCQNQNNQISNISQSIVYTLNGSALAVGRTIVYHGELSK